MLASRLFRLAALRNLGDELRLHIANSAPDLLDLFFEFRVWNKPANLRERRL